MTQIITFSQTTININHIQSTNGSHLTTGWIPTTPFKDLKYQHHKLIKELIVKFKLKSGTAETLQHLVNCCDKQGVTRVTLRTLALMGRCTERTIQNRLDRLRSHGIIGRKKNSWKQSCTTIILVIQHLNYNKQETFSNNLTSLSPLRRGGEREREKIKKKEAYAPADARNAPRKPDKITELSYQIPDVISLTDDELVEAVKTSAPYLQKMRQILNKEITQ